MASMEKILRDPSLVVMFTYAPAGLGHLRVTDALYHGLPEGITPILFGSQDTSLKWIHRLISRNAVTRSLMEWVQTDPMEHVFTYIYRSWIRRNTQQLADQLATALQERIVSPKTMLIVATHFGLAHQLAAVKTTLEKQLQVRIFLFVQVTDDSPQDIWYVPGADLTFVPSYQTAETLRRYGKQHLLGTTRFVITPYPISPVLQIPLSEEKQRQRKAQLDPSLHEPLIMTIPISGAAVGTTYFSEITKKLHRHNTRFQFHIIASEAPYTLSFLDEMRSHEFVSLYTSPSDRVIVNLYEKVYSEHVVSLEITKPSEQAFKALFTPQQVGGSLLLFTHPVGRQEYDNLHFLRRHHLLPDETLQEELWHHALRQTALENAALTRIHTAARSWRGLQLPTDPNAASTFILWCLEHDIFSNMATFHHASQTDMHVEEVTPTGVEQFWETVAKFLQEKGVSGNS